MYHILSAPRDKEWLDEWVKVTGYFEQIKGYTDLGDVFLINSKTNEIGILFTMQNSFEPMGFTDWNEFTEMVLNDSGFQENVVNPGFIERIKEHCGELSDEQVYVATPYPCIGGSGAPETYKKGDVWVYLSISAQTWSQI